MDDLWDFLDRMIASSKLVIDRPKGTCHPRFPELVYPLDYGYLDGTLSCDSGGIDVWLGSTGSHYLSGILVTVDAFKRDAEIKLLLGCSEEEIQTAYECSNHDDMRAILVRR